VARPAKGEGGSSNENSKPITKQHWLSNAQKSAK